MCHAFLDEWMFRKLGESCRRSLNIFRLEEEFSWDREF